jgi:tetratricopeptide (TPR) repeat protein/predicted Ser/Thr protein kinase
MGDVYLAIDTALDRKVALKYLSGDIASEPHARERFLREARAAAALDHPFICKIYETGEDRGMLYIAMEYVEGETLAQRLERRPLSLDEIIRASVELAEALQVAHGHGIVHRDLKPANIILTQGHAKVMDFGLAKKLPPNLTEVDSEALTAPDRGRTEAGVVVGTLAYMSPEQAKGEPVDTRSDIFAFGVVLFEMVSGEHPFRKASKLETVSAILKDPPPALKIRGPVPRKLRSILQKCLAKMPAERYENAESLALDLKQLRSSVERTARTAYLWAAGLSVAILLLAGAWWMNVSKRSPSPPSVNTPVSILIADFENRTGEAVLDGVLEQAAAIGLEDAPFISAYARGRAREVAGDIDPSLERLDEGAARLVAQREGINVVVTGSITAEGSEYRLALEAVDGVSGERVSSSQAVVSSKDEILPAIGELVVQTRKALGDTVPTSVEVAARETFTAASLEAAQSYARAQELMTAGRWAEAIPVYMHAVQLDPDFGRAYAGLAASHANLNQAEEGKKYYERALSRIDRMTDREKHRTRGGYYLLVRNYENAAEEYQALVDKYPSDPAGSSNLPLAYFYGRSMGRALATGRLAVEAHPENILTRGNLALYAMYASDFETAASEAEKVRAENPSYETAYVPAAIAKLDNGDIEATTAIYSALRDVSPWGASLASTGLADLALYQGDLDRATDILTKGIDGDRATGFEAEAARKLIMLARVALLRGDKPGAADRSEEALSASGRQYIMLAAASILSEAGREERALELASALATRLEPEPRTYAKLIEGQVELQRGNAQRALALFGEAKDVLDTWLGRFLVGLAYLDASAYTEAYSEFENCLKRRGEAAAIFLDDVPSYHYLPTVYFYLGRAQEGLGSPAAADSYKRYLSLREKGSASDTNAIEARRRLKELDAIR